MAMQDLSISLQLCLAGLRFHCIRPSVSGNAQHENLEFSRLLNKRTNLKMIVGF